MTLDEPTDSAASRAARLRAHATSAGKQAGAATQNAGSALVEAVGNLADAAVDHVLLTGKRVTSAAEGKQLLAGGADMEALADKVQRVVVLAVPVIRVLIRSARFSRMPWAILAASTVSAGIAVRTGRARAAGARPRSSPTGSRRQRACQATQRSSRRWQSIST